jgi:hypothetical protein
VTALRPLCTIAQCPATGHLGAVAQLVAHHTGSVGVRGSSPLGSTQALAVQRPRRRSTARPFPVDWSGEFTDFHIGLDLWSFGLALRPDGRGQGGTGGAEPSRQRSTLLATDRQRPTRAHLIGRALRTGTVRRPEGRDHATTSSRPPDGRESYCALATFQDAARAIVGAGIRDRQRLPRPASRARTMACARSATASFVKIFDTWLRTVFWLMCKRVAIAPFGCP